MSEYIIGINGLHYSAAACVLDLAVDEPVLLLSEDRHSGHPHHYGFPFHALRSAIEQVGAEHVVAVGYSFDKTCFRSPPDDYFSDLLPADIDIEVRRTIIDLADRMEAGEIEVPALHCDVQNILRMVKLKTHKEAHFRKRLAYLLQRYSNKIRLEEHVRAFLPRVEIVSIRHHRCHAANFLASPFDEAVVITWDGRGEFDTIVLWHGAGMDLERRATVNHPHSIGSFYELFTDYIGFAPVSGPGKLMGLAAYGDDRFHGLFESLITVAPDEFDYELDPHHLFCSQNEPLAARDALTEVIGPRRNAGEPLDDRHAAIASAAQHATERACGDLLDQACAILDTRNVVVSGGLALNCVANESLRRGRDIDLFMLPACGDDGTALGAALLLKQRQLEVPRKHHRRLVYTGSYGTQQSKDDVISCLDENELEWNACSAGDVAALIAADKVVGVINGRYEFGPRAFGFRSILADPRPAENWPRINQTVKFRDDFRPFAPAMLVEDAAVFWGDGTAPVESPYMLLAPVMNDCAAETLGATIHADRTCRLQTVDVAFNPSLHAVLIAFKALTGIGALLNTSLNVSGESIIADVEDLLAMLAFSGLDAIAVDNAILVEKRGNETALAALVDDIPDKEAYLKRRRDAYQRFLDRYGYRDTYVGFDRLYEDLFGEPPALLPVDDLTRL